MTVSASDHGFKAWSFDPAIETSAGAALADGVVSLVGLRLLYPTRIRTISAYVHTAGATIANCFAGLYNQAGARLAVTADQATPWTSTGLKAMPLTAEVDVPAGWLYAALLEGSGTTDVQFVRGNHVAAALGSAGMVAPRLRSSTSGSGLTALPASIATGGLSAGGNVFWVALS